MEAPSATDASPLAVVRKPLGCAAYAGGPFKSFAETFGLFFEAVLSVVALGNTDVIETITHLEVAAEEQEVVISPAKIAIQGIGHMKIAEAPAQPMEISDSSVAATECAKPDTTIGADIVSPFDTGESPVEVHSAAEHPKTPVEVAIEGNSGCAAEIDAVAENTNTTPAAEQDVVEHTLVAAGYVTVTNIDHTTPAQPVDFEESATSTDEDVILAATPAVASIIEPKPVTDIELDVSVNNAAADEALTASLTAPLDSALAAADELLSTETTAMSVVHTEHNQAAEQVFDNDTKEVCNDIVEEAKNAVIENSNTTHHQEGIPDSLGNTCDDFIADDNKDQASTADFLIPILPLVFEDDFDAAVSTVFDKQFERQLDVDAAWSTPHVVEKGKPEREIVRERLASRKNAQFNLQNLRLERAARALTIDGTAPTQVTKTTPVVTRSQPTLTAEVFKHEDAAPSSAELNDMDAEQTSSDNEDAVAQLAEQIAASRIHSRSTSSGSTESKASSKSDFDQVPCPGTPMTECSTTPTKETVFKTPAAASQPDTEVETCTNADKGHETQDVAHDKNISVENATAN
jgi:hypothetical protein